MRPAAQSSTSKHESIAHTSIDWRQRLAGLGAGAWAGAIVGVVLALLKTMVALEATGVWWVVWLVMPGALAVIGATLPLLAPHLIGAFKRFASPLGLSTIKVTLPGLGTTDLTLGNPQRAAARRIFLEMTTRTVTQPLEPGDGTLRAALNSLYELFGIVRDELKEMPPTPPGTPEGTATLESLAHRMLNHAIRPYTSRWHPRLDAWEETGLGETDWPLYELCWHDFDRMRSLAIGYAHALGRAAHIVQLEHLTPQAKHPDIKDASLDATTAARFRELDEALASAPSPQHRLVAWKLAVSCRTVASEARASAGRTEASDALTRSLEALSRKLAWEVGRSTPTPGNRDLDETGLRVIDEFEAARAGWRSDASHGAGKLVDVLTSASKDFETIARAATKLGRNHEAGS